MDFFKIYPVSRLIVPFILGIVTAVLIGVEIVIPFWVFIAFIAGIIVLNRFYKVFFHHYALQWINGLLIGITIFLIGFRLTIDYNQSFLNSHFGQYLQESSVLLARVIEPPSEKENTYKVVASVKKVINDSTEHHQTKGKLITYIEKDSIIPSIQYGDVLLIKADIREVDYPSNPNEFNYKAYLEKMNIFHQAYIPSGNWEKVGKGKTNILFKWSYNLRDYFIEIFKDNGLEGVEFGVATALILGYDDKLSNELTRKFSHAGAMHVLCVSGLHVGIIYLIIASFLKPLKRFKQGDMLFALIIVLCIWFFALITGLSSSVMRAATMFSFVAMGSTIKRKNNIYNTLALSAFLLLIINPLLISDVGFQLSYAAVIGIVAIQPGIYSLWKPRYWLIDKAWAIVAVSIAAQIGTLPLALHYFNQFPNYFIISNILVIPLATIIIYAGVFTLLFSFSAIVSIFSTKLLAYCILALNSSVSFIDSLPFSFTDGITISPLQVVLLYLVIIFTYFFFIKNKSNYLKLSLLLGVVIFALSASHAIIQYKEKKLVVYDIYKQTAIDLIHQNKSILIANKSLLKNREKIDFHIKSNWFYSHIKDNIKIPYPIKDSVIHKGDFYFARKGFIQFYDKRIALLNTGNNNLVSNKKIAVDFVVISGDIQTDLDKLLEQYKCKKVIFDASNSKWKIKKWITICKKLNLDYHSVPHSGAFVLKL